MAHGNIDRAAELIARARYVVAMTGAGMSVESGIPPFRGPGGLWTRYGEPPMDGYQRFLADPRRSWEESLNQDGPMRELFETLERARPNPGHLALAELERMGVLRCLITQNVDDLHRAAGSQAIAEIHGNCALTRCIDCGRRDRKETVSLAVLPPRCAGCGGLLKSDAVFFGEPIPSDVLERCFEETELCDCMVVVGTSATVYPAAQFPLSVLERGGRLVEFNPHPTEITGVCAVSVRAPAGEALPLLIERVKELRGGRSA